MDLICVNPFRVLGLPANATDREIARRSSDLSTYAALGKSKAYEWDLPLLGPIDRTAEAVGEAARRLEQRENKLFHAVFWFSARHAEDQAALAMLKQSQPGAALSIWSRILASSGAYAPSSARFNRAALNRWLSTRRGFNDQNFAEALTDLGTALRRDLRELETATLGQAAASLHADSAFRGRVVDALVAAGQPPGSAAFGAHGLGMLKYFADFPDEAKEHARRKLTGPVIEGIERAIAASSATSNR